MRVDNPDIQTGLLNGEFGGVSLYNRVDDKCGVNLHGTIRYDDIDAECVIPLFISLVEKGANGYGLHVMDYNAFISKSDKGAKKMAFDLLSGLKSLIKQAEEEDSSNAVIVKEDKTNEEEEEQVETKSTEEETEEAEIQKEDEEAESEKEDEAEISKEDEDADADFEAKVTAIVEKILAEKLKETEEEEVVDEEPETTDEDTPKIVKSSKVIVSTENQIETKNYYEMSGRDPITGKKLR